MRSHLSTLLQRASKDAERQLSGSDMARIALWPLGALLGIALIWFVTLARLSEERSNAEQDIRHETTASAISYANQLAQAVAQIDQIVLNLKDDWENPAVLVDIERKQRRGLFPNSASLFATIVNVTGSAVTSSLVSDTPVDFSTAQFFQAQKAGCCNELLITPPQIGLRLGRPVIRMSRRLEAREGGFDGVAFVSIEPSYLLSFQTEGLSDNDFVSVRLVTGQLLASRLGTRGHQDDMFTRLYPLFPGEAGIEREPGEHFRDGKPRYVAWRKLDKYPLVAIAALSEYDALAPYRAQARVLKQTAALATFLLILLGGVGTVFSTRLAWRRRREEEVRLTYRLATDAANEGFFMLVPVYNRGHPVDFRLEDCNQHGAALIGLTREEVIGRRVSELKPARYREEISALCAHTLQTGLYESEVRVAPQSPVHAKWVYRRMVRSGSGLALTVRDISAIKEHEEALARLANSDALTLLPNRRWLTSFLPGALRRAEQACERLALLFIDLDNFKNVNDTLGHDAGDELLQQAAARLKGSVRASDYVVRLGGDEFTVVLEHFDVMEDVSRVAHNIVQALGQPFTLTAGAGNQVNASIGIACYPEDGADGETLLKNADIAMYAAKAGGKGQYQFYHAHLSDALVLRMSKERALRRAVERDEFIIHYQPRVGARSGTLTSMEALVRWMHPERGIVYPAEFIDIAEDLGLIVPLGELVIEKVCAQLAAWQADGHRAVPVSINVSPLQLKSGTVSAVLDRSLRKHRIAPQLLEVELTESAVIDRSQAVSHELEQLRRLGIKLMIDDFGTGHSSLAQLHRLDVDVLKVDQAFTQVLAQGTEGETIFRAIVSMASALDMCVVAEGVETTEQLEVLRSLACDEVQGYLVSQAVAAHEIARLMRRRDLLPAQAVAEHRAS
ncbi:EAL domain-containing protein [Oxalobacteraceae bacterium OM1]|nr:EAL domain-containing protein [Oxalobacteraceae bacterium OM1]